MKHWISYTLGLVTIGVIAGGCVPKADEPFKAIAVEHMFRERALENKTPPLTPMKDELDLTYLDKRPRDNAGKLVDQAKAPAVGGLTKRMKLRELIQLAAANSLDVRVAGYQPAIDGVRVIEAEAAFDMVLFSSFNFQNQWLLSPSVSNPFASNQQFETGSAQVGIKQRLETGGQVQLQYNYQRVSRYQSGSGERTYEGDLQLQITQPLLQNFGSEVNRARITVARYTQRVSQLDFRLALEKNLAEIEMAYWQLVQAYQDLGILELLFNQTITTSEKLKQRVDQDVTRVQLGQANAQLRLRELALIEPRTRIRNLSHEIKRRVNDPSMPVASEVTILPEDAPLTTPIQFDLAEQIDIALKSRAEIIQQRLRIESASVVQRAAKNNLLPSLNLVLTLGNKNANNLWERTWIDQFDGSFREYGIGLQFEVPLGNREAKSIYRRVQLQRLQAIDQYRSLIEEVTLNVKSAHDNVYEAWQRIIASKQSVLAAEDALAAILQEENVGNVPLTPDFINRKLASQEVLAQTRREQARAISDYNTAISTLERQKGTLLKYDNVLMAEEPTPVAPPSVFSILKGE